MKCWFFPVSGSRTSTDEPLRVANCTKPGVGAEEGVRLLRVAEGCCKGQEPLPDLPSEVSVLLGGRIRTSTFECRVKGAESRRQGEGRRREKLMEEHGLGGLLLDYALMVQQAVSDYCRILIVDTQHQHHHHLDAVVIVASLLRT